VSKDLAASVRARLLNKAKAEQSDFNGVLVRYALERLLYRLSRSVHADRFLLKGAMLFTLWYEFANDASRQALWRAFLKKNQLNGVPLPELVAVLRARFEPPLKQAVSMNGLS
jgi:hypothetical protein